MMLHEDYIKIMQFIADLTAEIITRNPLLKVDIVDISAVEFLGEYQLKVEVIYITAFDSFRVQQSFDCRRVTKFDVTYIAATARCMIEELSSSIRKNIHKYKPDVTQQ
jgi:hypothetical protein